MNAKKKPVKGNPASSQVRRWTVELEAAKKEAEKFHTRGRKIIKRFKDEREAGEKDQSKWNLFTSSVQTQQALLYGQVPKVDVKRRFDDFEDDVARVAGIIMERALNCEIEEPTDTYAQALWHALQDRLLPGMGMCRVRYEREEEQVAVEPATTAEDGSEIAPEVPAHAKLVGERVCVEYVPWTSHLWSPAETFDQVRWWAFRNDMSRAQLVKRFGELGKQVPLKNSKERGDDAEDRKPTPWGRAQVWEIWDKESRKVYWHVEGFGKELDEQDDPLELAGFWPFARPMFANPTTDTLVPTPDFVIAQDLYNEIDDLSTRIKYLQKAVAVRGAYDKTSEGLQRLLTEALGNELIPIDGFAAFMEKGGIAGAIAWLPLDNIIQAIAELSKSRMELRQALWEITGMSDLMRGQADSEGATATEQSIKAKFGSVRMTAVQKEFARFASDLQSIKAELMANFFDPATLIERSNIDRTPDAKLAGEAVELIKSRFGLYRIEVTPESVSMADFAAMRSEAAEFVAGISQFMTAAAPLVEKIPGSSKALLQLLSLVMAKFNGFGNEAEGIIDKAIKQLEAQQEAQAANPQAPPPDPKVQAEQLKQQGEQQRVALEHRADMEKLSAEAQLEASKQQSQAEWNVREAQAVSQLKVREAHAMPKPPAPKGAKK